MNDIRLFTETGKYYERGEGAKGKADDLGFEFIKLGRIRRRKRPSARILNKIHTFEYVSIDQGSIVSNSSGTQNWLRIEKMRHTNRIIFFSSSSFSLENHT